MSITTPKSSDQITNTSVEQMHNETRAIVNDLVETNIGRSSINVSQLGAATLVQNSGRNFLLGNTYVTAVVTAYNSSTGATGLYYTSTAELLTEATSWTTIMSTNAVAASGTTYKSNSPMIINYNCRVSEFVNSGGTAIVLPFANYMIFFAIIIERTNSSGSADNVIIEESVAGVHLAESLTYNTDDSSGTENRIGGIEQAVSFSALHTIDPAFTYGFIRIKAAICPCESSTTSTTDKINLKNGFVSFIVMEPGA